MHKFLKPKTILIFICIVLSYITWITLYNLEHKGEIEGPLVYVNGNLWMALFFSFPLSWIGIEILNKRLKNSKWKRIISILVFFIGLIFWFVILGITFLFLHSEIGTLIDELLH